jgi:hypothetical protein
VIILSLEPKSFDLSCKILNSTTLAGLIATHASIFSMFGKKKNIILNDIPLAMDYRRDLPAETVVDVYDRVSNLGNRGFQAIVCMLQIVLPSNLQCSQLQRLQSSINFFFVSNASERDLTSEPSFITSCTRRNNFKEIGLNSMHFFNSVRICKAGMVVSSFSGRRRYMMWHISNNLVKCRIWDTTFRNYFERTFP